MILPIVKYGDPVLRRKALPIKTIDDKIKTLAGNMIETMITSGGCGLSGPQVNEDLRIFVVMAIPSNCFSFIDILRAPDYFLCDRAFAIINPEVKLSGSSVSAPEGCLSLPGIKRIVTRPSSVRVKAMLICGHMVNFIASGLLGRIIQHENDHLNGKMIIDYERLKS